MESSSLYVLMADAILLLHVMYVSFVIVGFLLILIGKVLTWAWVKNPWFRVTHLVSICLVIVESWLGVMCPLTTWEMALRSQAGDVVYVGSFLTHWLESLLYYQAPAWVFIVCYTAFGAMVMVSWYWVRPRRFW